MGRIIPYIMENTKCLKPPTSHLYHLYMGVHAPFSDKPNSLPALCFLLRSWHISVRTSGLWGHQTRKTLLSLGRESELVTENPSRIHGSMGFKWKKTWKTWDTFGFFVIYDDSKWSTWDNFTVCYGNCDVQKRHIIARGYLSHQPAFFVQPIFRNPQNIWLVVEPPLLKNMKVTWDDYSQYIMEK